MKLFKKLGGYVGKLLKALPGSSIIKEAKNTIIEVKQAKNYWALLKFGLYLLGVLIISLLLWAGFTSAEIRLIFEMAGEFFTL